MPLPIIYETKILPQWLDYMDLNTRRSANLPEQVQADIKSLAQKQAYLKRTDNIGRKICIRR